MDPGSRSNKGSRHSFPRHRLTVLDIARESQRIPSFPLVRTMHLAQVAAARAHSSAHIGWPVLFAKAYGMVCASLPELRDVFVQYPLKHFYRHPYSVASISIHRKDDAGNERLIWGRWGDPESTSLVNLQQQLDQFRTAPMAKAYRQGLRLEKYPALLRRFLWWSLMQCAGRKRAKHIGTFSISSLGSLGALNLHHPLVTTSSLAFGPLDTEGNCEVALICDHRTLDGVVAAKALEQLERTLQNDIVHELMQHCPANSQAA